MNTSSPTLELEVMPPEVAAVSTELSTTKETALAAFTPFQKLFAESKSLLDREATATTTAQARELRLAMKKHRGTSKATKDNVKADILLAGRLADAYFNRITGPLENAEARLDEIEKAEERRIAAEKTKLAESRSCELRAVGVDPQFYPLGDMPAEAYAQLLSSSKLAHETKIAAAAKAEADAKEAARVAELARIAKEQADAEERERVRLENERLKREATEREEAARVERDRVAAEKAEAEKKRLAELAEIERLAKIERDRAAAELAKQKEAEKKARDEAYAAHQKALAEAEEKAKKEREAAESVAREAAEKARVEREAIEAKARADKAEADRIAKAEREKREALERAEAERLAAEALRQKDEADALARAAAAPDKEKLLALASLAETLEVPEMSTKAGKNAASIAAQLIVELGRSIRFHAEKL